MKPKHKKLAKRAKSRSTMAYCTRSISMSKMSLSKMVMPSFQKQESAYCPQNVTNIIGCRITHEWKEGNEPITEWKAIILDQMPTTPTVYLVKYDGIDCVYGMQLQSDKRISKLKILPINVSFPQVNDTNLENAIVGKEVEHTFVGKSGSKENWRGWVLAQVPIMKTWFYITYEKDPVLYIYQLLEDYLDGNLRAIRDSLPTEVKSDVGSNALTGDFVDCTQEDGNKRIGKVICKLPTRPCISFIQFDDDPLIYVYNFVKDTFKRNIHHESLAVL